MKRECPVCHIEIDGRGMRGHMLKHNPTVNGAVGPIQRFEQIQKQVEEARVALQNEKTRLQSEVTRIDELLKTM